MGFIEHTEEGFFEARSAAFLRVRCPAKTAAAMDQLGDKLRAQNWNDLYPRLYAFSKARTGDGERGREVTHAAVAKVFAFDSKWDPDKYPDIFRHLVNVVTSILANQRTSAAAKRSLSIDDGALGAEMAARLADPNLSPDDAQAIHDIYVRRLERLRARLADDPDAARLLELTLEGHDKPAELRRMTGWSDDVLRAARTRMQRAALAVARNHPDDPPKEKK